MELQCSTPQHAVQPAAHAHFQNMDCDTDSIVHARRNCRMVLVQASRNAKHIADAACTHLTGIGTQGGARDSVATLSCQAWTVFHDQSTAE